MVEILGIKLSAGGEYGKDIFEESENISDYDPEVS